jgi:hypothetical protein
MGSTTDSVKEGIDKTAETLKHATEKVADAIKDTAYYQRLLARDDDEALEIVDEFLKTHALEAVYDTVLVPALVAGKQDRQHNSLTEDDWHFIVQATRGDRRGPRHAPVPSRDDRCRGGGSRGRLPRRHLAADHPDGGLSGA